MNRPVKIEKKIKFFYDKHPKYELLVQAALRKILKKKSNTLTVGCGQIFLKPNNKTVHMTTGSMLKYSTNFQIVIADCNALPFSAKSFEQIIIAHYIEHAKNYQQAINNLDVLLKDNGSLVFVMANQYCLKRKTFFMISGQKKAPQEVFLQSYLANKEYCLESKFYPQHKHTHSVLNLPWVRYLLAKFLTPIVILKFRKQVLSPIETPGNRCFIESPIQKGVTANCLTRGDPRTESQL